MTWTTVGVIVLVGWLVIATGTFVVIFVRRLLANRGAAAARLLRDLDARSVYNIGGPSPRLPPPEWVDWEKSKSSDDD
jgi:hypothetical protein